MVQDVSKVTIMILLMLTIIVSVLSTIIILDRAEQLKARPVVVQKQQNQGYVSLTIGQNTELEPVSETGRVSLKIEKQ